MTTAEEMRGRIALVTGASTGIGAEFAARLAVLGADLVLVARSEDRLGTLADDLRGRCGVAVTTVPLDLSQPGAPAVLSETVTAAGLTVEMLVNNAGLALTGPVASAEPAAATSLIAVNATALTEITMRFLPGMLGRGRGTVLNVASTGAYQPAPYLAVYAASKAYVLSFTEALWAETRGSGVRVVAVSPGPTDTPMNSGPGRGKRTPGQVVDTALHALATDRPSIVDGTVNAVFARVVAKHFPDRVVLGLAERLSRPS